MTERSRIRRAADASGWTQERIQMAWGSGWPARYDSYIHDNMPGLEVEVWTVPLIGHVTKIHLWEPATGFQSGRPIGVDEALAVIAPRAAAGLGKPQ